MRSALSVCVQRSLPSWRTALLAVGIGLDFRAFCRNVTMTEGGRMTTPTFDALSYFDKLKTAGVPEDQARVQAAAFREFSAIQEENARRELATKLDLAQLKMELTEKIEATKHETIR